MKRRIGLAKPSRLLEREPCETMTPFDGGSRGGSPVGDAPPKPKLSAQRRGAAESGSGPDHGRFWAPGVKQGSGYLAWKT